MTTCTPTRRTSSSREVDTRIRSRFGRVLRRLVLTSAATGLLVGGLAVTPASAAGVNPFSIAPYYDCYSNQVVVDKPALNQVGTVAWQPELEVYNGTAWAVAGWGSVENINTNLTFYQLTIASQTFNVLPNRYYRIFFWTSVNGAPYTYLLGKPVRDGISNSYCLTR